MVHDPYQEPLDPEGDVREMRISQTDLFFELHANDELPARATPPDIEADPLLAWVDADFGLDPAYDESPLADEDLEWMAIMFDWLDMRLIYDGEQLTLGNKDGQGPTRPYSRTQPTLRQELRLAKQQAVELALMASAK